jgi:hypothetical protein
MTKKTKSSAWLEQSLNAMKPGIDAGKTRRRKVETVRKLGISEVELKSAAEKLDMKVAQVGDNYVFTPSSYTIRPL